MRKEFRTHDIYLAAVEMALNIEQCSAASYRTSKELLLRRYITGHITQEDHQNSAVPVFGVR